MSSVVNNCPYDYEVLVGPCGTTFYYVKVWLLVAEGKVFSFFSRHDLLENFFLASEAGVSDLYVTSASLLASPIQLVGLYNTIESYVSCSDIN